MGLGMFVTAGSIGSSQLLEQLPALHLFDPVRFLSVRSVSLSVSINPPDIPVIWAHPSLLDIG